MKFLNENITITLNNLTIPADSTYQYQVMIGNELVFVGNCFITTADTSYTFYLNDILKNYMFNGKIQDGGNQKIIDEVYVELIIDGSTSYGATIEVAFLYKYPNKNSIITTPIPTFDSEYWSPLLQGFDYINNKGVLLPTYPYTYTNKLLLNYLGTYGGKGVTQYLKTINTETGQYSSGNDFLIGENIKNCVWGLGNYSTGDYFGYFKNVLITKTNMKIIDTTGFDITAYNTEGGWSCSGTISNELARVMVTFKKGNSTTIANRVDFTNNDVTIDCTKKSNVGYEKMNIGLFLISDIPTQHPSLTIELDVTKMFNRPNEYDVPLKIRVYFNALTNMVTVTSVYAEIDEEDARPDKLYIDTTVYGTSVTEGVKTYIANIDYCSRYFLKWMDRYGMPQIQPFDGTMTYSEGFEYNQTINYRDERKHSGINVQPKWRINTKWLDKTVYPFYESIFISPYLQLYDAQEDEIYNVVVTNTDYIEKTFKNQNKQQFNLQLDIELNKKQSIIY